MPRRDSPSFLLLPATLLAAVVLFPLAGAWSAGRIPHALWTFPPPVEIPEDFPPCSWIGRGATLLAYVGLAVGALAIARRSRALSPKIPRDPNRPFPAWGWAALAWTLAWWLLAWTRFAWFAPLQLYTFFPLWAGFIMTVNALTWRRGGSCLMLRAPRAWLALFAVSATFWWCFEWMNRFVLNWHYLRMDSLGATGHVVHGSLCFSTVLPAVLAVREWLGTHPGWFAGCSQGPRWRWLGQPRSGLVLVAAGVLGLALTGAFPRQAYPALWTAPLLIALGILVFTRESGWWSEVADGDWQSAAFWAVAALICGCFWEMWNVFSLAKWIYTIPYMDCWPIFEMPLPGYLGYLTFGLECAIAVHWCRRGAPGRS